MKKQSDISALAEKWLKGTITEAEKKEFEDWYNSQPGLDMHWLKDDTEEEAKSRIFGSIMDRLEIPEPAVRHISWPRRLSVAAAIALAIGGAAFYLFSGKRDMPQQPAGVTVTAAISTAKRAMLTLADGSTVPLDSLKEGILARQGQTLVRKLPGGEIVYENAGASAFEGYNILTVPRGGATVAMVLADGSKVWLNAESSLHYPVVFTDDREVDLTGEGYFDIRQSATHQFEVHTGDVTTYVLGTTFNVNTYNPQQGVLVTLLNGAVKVSNAATAKQLRPGQQAGATAGNIRLNAAPDMEAVTAWKNGLIKLNNSDIYTVMSQLARWYDVDVQIGKGMESRRFSGLISRSTSLDTVLDMLSMTKEVRFKREGNTVIVSPYQ